MQKNIFGIGIITLLVFSTVAPMVFGYNVSTMDMERTIEEYDFDIYHVSEITNYKQYTSDEEYHNYDNTESEVTIKSIEATQLLEGPPIDSPWPMYCHDTRHTGRSPYSTADTHHIEKWWFWTEISGIHSGIVISEDGAIYFSGSYDFYSIYLNGTLKWRYGTGGIIVSCPAIDENGIIYVGTTYDIANGDHLYAFYPNGTLKWKYNIGQIYSSPAIGIDGAIYFGIAHSDPDFGEIYALFPNGTLKWNYMTDDVVLSSPAIGEDGTIYCGSHDTYLYALHPNNGTLKWRYKTGHWIRTAPCIADDGTIYVVSLDNHLHAVNPNGTLKWKTNMGQAGTSPTIGQDGTIYCGYSKLHAINPSNGSVKWTFDVGGTIRGSTPCNSFDGTIYVGTSNGGEIIAINQDGTEKWRRSIGECESPPAIGEDGTVYIGTIGINDGYLYAFGPLDQDAPTAPEITGETSGIAGTEYEYSFKSTSPLGRDVYYYITWGDGSVKDWFGPFNSNKEAKASHTWSNQGTYTISARAKDTDNLWGP